MTTTRDIAKVRILTLPGIHWRRIALHAAALVATFALGAGSATYALLAHGDAIGGPVMLLGAKLVQAADPAVIQKQDTIAPLKGELDERPEPPPPARPTKRKGR